MRPRPSPPPARPCRSRSRSRASLPLSSVAPGLFTAFGAFFHDYLLASFHVFLPWWLLSLAGMVVVCWLSLRSIKASVNLDLTLLVIDVVIFLALGVLAVTKSCQQQHGGGVSGRLLAQWIFRRGP